MRSRSFSAAALGVTLIFGSTALERCVADQPAPAPQVRAEPTAPASEARTERSAVRQPSVRLNSGRTPTPRRFLASWPYGVAVVRPWPYIYPNANSRNYWAEWNNVPALYRDPNRYAVYGYGYPLFFYQKPYPYTGFPFPYGL